MKKDWIVMLFLAMLVAVNGAAQTEWTLRGNVWRVDTLSHYPVGPGTVETRLLLSKGKNTLHIWYADVTLADSVNVRVARGKGKAMGLQPVSGIMADNTNENRTAFLGVNADFFDYNNMQPRGACIADGEVYSSNYDINWPHLVVDSHGRPYIGVMEQMTGKLQASGISINIDRVNVNNDADIILFTDSYGSKTPSSDRWELVLTPAKDGQRLVPNTRITMHVASEARAARGAIPAGSFVLSASSRSMLEKLESYTKDVYVTVAAHLLNNTSLNLMDQMVGGIPILLSKGAVQSMNTVGPDLYDTRHPRTIVGYDRYKRHFIIMVVDGRTTGSTGLDCFEEADAMKALGCYDALNLDGGGSSEMYIRGLGVQNNPSDGRERSVTNAVLLTTEATPDQKIASLTFKDWRISGNMGDTYHPILFGYDRHGLLIDTEVKGCVLASSSDCLRIEDGNIILLRPGDATLTATLDTLETTVNVHIASLNGMNPYASGLKMTSTTTDFHLYYTLNARAEAATLRILADGMEVSSIELIGEQLFPGTHDAVVDKASLPRGQILTWEIEVKGEQRDTPLATGPTYPFYCPYGAAVDNNTESPRFGRLYVSESYSTANSYFHSGNGSGNGNGVYLFDEAFQPILASNGLAGFTGNAGFAYNTTFGQYGYYDPKTLRITDDGRVLIGRTNGTDRSPLWEMTPSRPENTFTSVFSGVQGNDGVTRTSGGAFMAGLTVSMAAQGSGDDLQLVILSCNADGSACTGGASGFFCNTYDLHKSKRWSKAPTSTYEPLNQRYVPSPQNVNIETDRRGGLWFVQHRESPSNQWPSVKHFRPDGTEDYSDITTVCTGGGLAVSPDGNIIAFPVGPSRVGVYSVDYDSNPVVLTPIAVFDTREGNNITALAFDWAYNLYVASNSNERIGCYALPRTSPVAVTPAPSGSTLMVPEDYDAVSSLSADADDTVAYRLNGTKASTLARGLLICRGRKKLVR